MSLKFQIVSGKVESLLLRKMKLSFRAIAALLEDLLRCSSSQVSNRFLRTQQRAEIDANCLLVSSQFGLGFKVETFGLLPGFSRLTLLVWGFS
ncbi:hypothetical protein, partial [Austwickia chelonae]|uniref:hypothetical protein n=1 Tax=Austwickia chelonae TaxID=100225 RepID=UPI001C433DC5